MRKRKDNRNEPRVVKLKLKISKKLAHKLGRVRRWEKRSEGVSLTLGPGARS